MNAKEQLYHVNGASFYKAELEFFCNKKIHEAQIEEWEQECYSFILEWISSSSTIRVQTSGSTGKPKVIHLKKKYMEASALATINFFNLKPGSNTLLCLPVKYIAGKMMIVRAFIGGLNLFLTKPASLPDIKSFQKIDFCAMVPNQIASLLEIKNGAEQLEKIRNLIVGGSFLSENIASKIKKLNNNVWQTYGMTETITHIALRKVNGENAEDWYTPLKGIEAWLDERECLVIHAKLIGVNNLVTNDLAEITKSGKFRITGRIDNVIISGGVKLIPEELENKLSGWIETEYYISSFPDEKLGSKLVLYIEDNGKLSTHICQLWEKIEAILTEFEIPKEIIFVSHFSRTSSDKIIRK